MTAETDGGSLVKKAFEARIMRALRRIIRAVDSHSHHLRQELNITTPQLICLHSINNNGPMTLSRLATDASFGLSTTTGIVDRLVAGKLVRKRKSRKDRRKLELTITDAGIDLIKAAPQLLHHRFSASFQQLDELEQAAITLSLEKVVSMMNVESEG